MKDDLRSKEYFDARATREMAELWVVPRELSRTPMDQHSLNLATVAIATVVGAAPVTSTSGMLDCIRESGKITLTYRDAATPFSYVVDQGEPIGYSTDLCQRLVVAVHRKLA